MKIDPFPGELTTQLVEHPFVTKTGKHGCQRCYTIVLTPEQRQWLCRYNALKRGYIILQDSSDAGGERYNIYYDAQTQRTDIFERNLIKDGFHLAPWSE